MKKENICKMVRMILRYNGCFSSSSSSGGGGSEGVKPER